MRRSVFWLYAVSVLFGLLTMILFVGSAAYWWFEGTPKVFGEYWDYTGIIGGEFALAVLGTAAFMVADFTRQGAVTSQRTGGALGRGTNRVDVGRRSYLSRALWMLVPLSIWGAITFVPLWASSVGDEYERHHFDPSSNLGWLIGANAFFAAGAFGVMVMSMTKALFYDAAERSGRIAARRPRRQPGTPTNRRRRKKRGGKHMQKPVYSPEPRDAAFWRGTSYFFRLELICGFILFGFLGVLPLALSEGEGYPPGELWAPIACGIIGVIGFIIAANSWRSGEPLTASESLTGGVL
jgi:hypothetical protein